MVVSVKYVTDTERMHTTGEGQRFFWQGKHWLYEVPFMSQILSSLKRREWDEGSPVATTPPDTTQSHAPDLSHKRGGFGNVCDHVFTIGLVYHYHLHQVHLFVGLSAGLHKNYVMHFNKIWMENGPRPLLVKWRIIWEQSAASKTVLDCKLKNTLMFNWGGGAQLHIILCMYSS